MSERIIRMTSDVYPYGCSGDIVPIDDAGLKRLQKIAKTRKVAPLYEEVNQANGSDEAEKSDDSPSLQDLRARAKELGVSAGGSKDEIQARIDEAEKSDD